MCNYVSSHRVSAKLKEIKIKYEQAKKDGNDLLPDLKKQLEELNGKEIVLKDHEEQMKKKEKLMPWYGIHYIFCVIL